MIQPISIPVTAADYPQPAARCNGGGEFPACHKPHWRGEDWRRDTQRLRQPCASSHRSIPVLVEYFIRFSGCRSQTGRSSDHSALGARVSEENLAGDTPAAIIEQHE